MQPCRKTLCYIHNFPTNLNEPSNEALTRWCWIWCCYLNFPVRFGLTDETTSTKLKFKLVTQDDKENIHVYFSKILTLVPFNQITMYVQSYSLKFVTCINLGLFFDVIILF